MRTQCFYHLLLTLAFLSLPTNSHAQAVDPATFFPHATGNKWHYRDIMGDRQFSDEWVDHDSADGHGGWWVYYIVKDGTIPGPPVLRHIDSNLDVYDYYRFSDPNPLFRYRLKAKVGDIWSFDPSDTSYKAEVIGITRGVVFGKVVTVMLIEYFSRYVGGEMWLQVHFLATGFGLIRIDAHPSARIDLTGATIDGTYYGDLASTVADDPIDLQTNMLNVYPNPSSSASNIIYHVDRPQRIRINLYDALGREFTTILDSNVEPGTHQAVISTEELSTGIYTLRISGITCNASRTLSIVR